MVKYHTITDETGIRPVSPISVEKMLNEVAHSMKSFSCASITTGSVYNEKVRRLIKNAKFRLPKADMQNLSSSALRTTPPGSRPAKLTCGSTYPMPDDLD